MNHNYHNDGATTATTTMADISVQMELPSHTTSETHRYISYQLGTAHVIVICLLLFCLLGGVYGIASVGSLVEMPQLAEKMDRATNLITDAEQQLTLMSGVANEVASIDLKIDDTATAAAASAIAITEFAPMLDRISARLAQLTTAVNQQRNATIALWQIINNS